MRIVKSTSYNFKGNLVIFKFPGICCSETKMAKEHVYVFGASHINENHHFPDIFTPLFKHSKRFYPPKLDEEIFPQPGGIIDQYLVDDIVTTAHQVSPSPSFFIVNYGDNNVRDLVRKNRHASAIFPLFVQLLDRLEEIPFCRVILTSLIPSFGRDEDTKEEFHSLNEFLRNLCKDRPRASYCCFVRQLFVNGELSGDYFDDNVHLSFAGATIMANAFHRHLYRLPRIKN